MLPLRRGLRRRPTVRRKSCPGRLSRPWLLHAPRLEKHRAAYAPLPRPDPKQMNDTQIQSSIWPAIGQMVDLERLSLRVSGRCMEPLLRDQARVTTKRANVYFPGDVLIVQRPSGSPVVHRLIGMFPAKGSLRYLTQADKSPTPDGSFTRDAILGKVCGGQCSPLAVNIPLRHRAKAVGRFVTFIGTRLRQRTWSLLKTT